ncbi:FAD-dependent monooxygenase [Halobaculum lipolyticum]|uniref:FAD-dependent monooxygenase n=1 Tax=Halobaculum lipolyticum TaxID=3032001 RepID=A0ABD5W8S8_9EURY|nr:FAD-dependent monooxygenase [Halobaculum sp. DT31]
MPDAADVGFDSAAAVDGGERFEAVVVGCGPGGATAAATLADNGVETLVLERGVEAGSKNVSGGLLYAEESAPFALDDLFPGFREEATERPVTRNRMDALAGDRVHTVDLGGVHDHDTAWCDSVLRRRMDSWVAERVHERTVDAGGGVLTGVRANGLLRENGEVVGVTCDELDPIRADVVVAADGVNSELARDAGLMDWEEPDEWFQGVKAVVDVAPAEVNERFGIDDDEGVARLFAGDLFDGVRGGGFLYTNRDSLSVGTVFHLDSLAAERAETHELLDALLTHPHLGQWIPDDYVEREYSAKLVPDSKKAAHPSPHEDRLLVVGDAAGQMQAQGPIIKGMNHAVTAGGLAAEAYLEARNRRRPHTAGERYERKLHDSGLYGTLKPRRYRALGRIGESAPVADAVEDLVDSRVGRLGVRLAGGLVERGFNSPFLLGALPDTRAAYATVPRVLAEELGEPVAGRNDAEPPTLEERIGDLTYDTDVGNPHIELTDDSSAASGTAVTACPVSAEGFGGGCYREETVRVNGGEERLVSLDTQPCVECGTCAVVAETEWTHPSGGKGVDFREG